MMITNEYWWKISLRLKLRQCSGVAFQDFFSTVMEKLYGSDFVRVRPFGTKGDKGCDGYLQSTGQVFACYGALNGDKSKVDYLIEKMDEDFKKAATHLGAIMKEWHLVHNLIDGLPTDAVLKMNELKTSSSAIAFGFFGLEAFELSVSNLPDTAREELLGPSATNQDSQNMQVSELQVLVNGIVAGIDGQVYPPEDISPVPVDKLNANQLPSYWRSLISQGWQNAYVVAEYLDNHPDPLTGEAIAALFRERYQYLRAQGLPPAVIMDGLYEFVTGIGSVMPARQVAAQALLAYLFESCDIFENASLEIVV